MLDSSQGSENAVFAHGRLDSQAALLVRKKNEVSPVKELRGERREFAQDPLASLFERLLATGSLG